MSDLVQQTQGPTSKPTLTSPKLRIVMADGSVHEIQTIYIDLREYERAQNRNGWPEIGKEPLRWLAWIGWHALTREDAITRRNFPEFETDLIDVGTVDEKKANPTPTEAEADSSSP